VAADVDGLASDVERADGSTVAQPGAAPLVALEPVDGAGEAFAGTAELGEDRTRPAGEVPLGAGQRGET